MITQALTGPTATGTVQPPQAPGGKLGKEEFLTLLVAQLRNQDPANPSRPEEFAAQLAQFSSLEQLINVNETLSAQAEANAAMAQALNNASAVNVLGRTVLALGDGVTVDGTGKETITAGVGGTGGTATLTLYDEDGEKVGSRELGTIGGGRREIELGSLSEGLAPGQYRYELTVTDEAGEPVQVQTFQRAAVDGLRYGSRGALLLAGGLEIPLADVVEIIVQTD